MANSGIRIWFHIVLVVLVLIFSMYASIVLIMADHEQSMLRFVSGIVLVSAIYLLIQRDMYLPFLGQTAIPTSLFKENISPNGSNVETDLVIDAPDGSRVLYWGAQADTQSKVFSTPQLAYKDYANAGIAVVSKGKATIRFFCPVKYEVPWGKTLDRHIHYRVVLDNGLIGPVRTTYVNC